MRIAESALPPLAGWLGEQPVRGSRDSQGEIHFDGGSRSSAAVCSRSSAGAQGSAFLRVVAATASSSRWAISRRSFYNGAGTTLADYTVSLAAGQWAQETQPFVNKAGQTAMDRGYAKITVQTGSAVFGRRARVAGVG